jgi:hypothetical protein
MSSPPTSWPATAAMIDFDQLRVLARGQAPRVPRSPSISPVAPVAPVAAEAHMSATGDATSSATGVSHSGYSVTGATGYLCKNARHEHQRPLARPVATPVATCSASAQTSEFAMDEAERATATIISEWLNRNPACSPPGRCLGCGGGELVDNPLLPFGVEPTGHAWLHSKCWRAWSASREVEAVRALARMGILPPTATQFSRAS